MCDKLKGVPIGPLHPDGEGLLVNESGTFMIDEVVSIPPEMWEKVYRASRVLRNMKGLRVVMHSTGLTDNPFYEYYKKLIEEKEN